MAYSYVEFTSNSSANGGKDYSYSFGAVTHDTANIKITVGGANLATSLYSVTEGTITLSAAPGSGSAPLDSALSSSNVMRVFRQTNRTSAEVTFSSASVLQDSDLNTATDQGRYLALEAVDRANESITIDENNAARYNVQVDGADKRIFGIATPIDDKDAVPKSYADSTVSQAETHADNASGSATTASGHVTTASNWATKTDGEVSGGEFSSKAYANSTDSDAPPTGSSKEWATNAGSGEVASGAGYSSKAYAQDETSGTDTHGGSSKGWAATAKNTQVPGAGTSDRSAKHYSEIAADHKNDAETAKTAAETALDSFDDRYLGSKAVADHPTQDNDGNSLLTGALYYNTGTASSTNVTAGLYVYNGSAWESMKASVEGNTVTSTSGNNLNLVTPSNSNKVVINSGDKTIQLPNVRASTNNYVLAMSDKTTGETAWQATTIAPTITSVSGLLNVDSDSTLTIVGSDFNASTSVKLFSAATGGTDIATATVDTSRVPTKLEATFGASALTTAGAGQQCFVELSNSGISTRHQTGITINVDPTATFSGGSGVNYSESTHLGTYGYQVDGGGQDSNTKLLLNFDRGGGTDIEDSSNTDGDGHKITATNAAIKASPFGDGKSAMYFDGSSNLQINDHADWDFGNNNFTIEYWASRTSTDYNFHFGWGGTDGTEDVGMRFNNDGAIRTYWRNSSGGTTNQTHAKTITDDAWHHYAYVRNGDTLSFYVDGFALPDTVDVGTNSIFDFDSKLGIGQLGEYTSNRFHGYIDNFRIVKGVAVYTGDFTVPTSRLSATQSNQGTNIADITGTATKLLLHSDIKNPMHLGGGATKTTSNVRSGNTHAWQFDGDQDYLKTDPNTPATSFGTGAYTIEFWFRADSLHNSTLFSTRRNNHNADSDAGDWLHLYTKVGGDFNLYIYKDSGTETDVSGGSYSATTWTHLAVVRTSTGSNGCKVYVDGSAVSALTNNDTTDYKSNKSFWLGISPDSTSGNWDFDGLIDQVRITKGLAVYTDDFDTDFTETKNFASTWDADSEDGIATNNDASKVTLLHKASQNEGTEFDDSSASNHTITATGSYHSQAHGGIAPAMTWPANLKKTGSAGIHFDGDGDYLDLGNASNLETALFSSTPTTLTFSVDYWVQYQNVGSDITILGTNQSGGYNFGLGIRSDKHLGFSGTSAFGEGTSNSTATTVVNNTWYHVLHVVTWKHAYTDASDKPKSYNYLDGVYKGYSEATYSNPGGAHNNRTQYAPDDGKFTIGGQIEHDSTTLARDFNGYLANFRVKIEDVRLNASDPLYTGDTSTPGTNTSSNNFSAGLPTKIYGSYVTNIIDKITFTGTTSADLADDEDIEFSEVTNTNQPAQKQDFSDIGLSITNLTGSNKNKATLTGTLNFADSTSVPKLAMKVQVRKTLGNSAGSSGQNTITFSSGTTTVGLSKDMIVTGTGINASETKITSVDSSTQISVDNNHASTVSGDLIFLDPDRVSHMNGNDTYSTGDTALTIATGPGSSPVFNARRYRGNSVGLREINGLGFQPDLVWIKNREDDNWNQLSDSVRGPNKAIFSNSGNQEDPGGQYLSEFLSDGFRLGKSGTGNSNVEDGINADNEGIIAWAWKAGGKPSGSLGTINSSNPIGAGTIANTGNATNITQSVNQNSGFSITKFTGSTSGVTFPHNLGGAPDFFIIKHLGTTSGWPTYHKDLSSINYYLSLNGNADEDEMSAGTGFVSAGTTNIQLGTDWAFGGAAANFICYAWKAVAGVSAFGSYDGNNTERTITFPNIGGVANEFAPSFVMIKTYDGSDNSWWIYDNARVPSGTRNNSNQLRADASHSESTNSTSSLGVTLKTDNGFTIHSSHGGVNDAANKYIYIAFA